ncbi:MAG TPA: lysoplasmalogenase [Spirochaetota bacterium]|nr:lysoplasmalogenase [Spirochaetota bacterium]
MIVPEYLYQLTAAYIIVFMVREYVAWKGILLLKYFFTPMITALAVFIVLSSLIVYGADRYSLFVFASLIAALIADTLLMIEEISLLKNGMVFFILGHLFYAAAFCYDITFSAWNSVLLIILLVVNFIHLRLMKKHAGRMFIPVVFYVIIIDIMGYLAIIKLNSGAGSFGITVALAAVLFWTSDFILSVNAFVKTIPHSTVYTWLFYAPAQLLFAWSAVLINRI